MEWYLMFAKAKVYYGIVENPVCGQPELTQKDKTIVKVELEPIAESLFNKDQICEIFKMYFEYKNDHEKHKEYPALDFDEWIQTKCNLKTALEL